MIATINLFYILHYIPNKKYERFNVEKDIYEMI